MQVHPDIAALRRNDAPQRQAQAALADALRRWQDRPETVAALADLARFADPAVPLGDCPALAGMLAGAGRGWVQTLIEALLPALAGEPLGHVPLRHFTNGVISTLLLGRAGETTLALVAVDGAALARRSPGPSIGFAPLESHELVLAGHASAELIEAPDARWRQAIRLAPGQVIVRDGAHRALRLLAVDGCLVSLRLQRRPRHGGVAHEVDLASGRLLHRSAGVMRESRHALMIALLGRMGRKDAAPVLGAIAREDAAGDLRWQALREGLGLDTASGFAALCAVADRGDDPLAAPAGALRAQLLETYPALRAIA